MPGGTMKVLLSNDEKRKYPNCPEELPIELFNDEWAVKIHSQTLARLNERGGLHPKEMICNILKKSYHEVGGTETGAAIAILLTLANNPINKI